MLRPLQSLGSKRLERRDAEHGRHLDDREPPAAAKAVAQLDLAGYPLRLCHRGREPFVVWRPIGCDRRPGDRETEGKRSEC